MQNTGSYKNTENVGNNWWKWDGRTRANFKNTKLFHTIYRYKIFKSFHLSLSLTVCLHLERAIVLVCRWLFCPSWRHRHANTLGHSRRKHQTLEFYRKFAFFPDLCTYTQMRKNSYNDKQGGFRKIISFRCRTCASNEIQNVCIVCANICHADHDVEIIERFADSVFCDCGALGIIKCQSLVKRRRGGLK